PDRRILPRILGSLTFHLSFGPARLSCAVRREARCPVIQRHSRTATIITALPFRHVNAISHSVDLLVLNSAILGAPSRIWIHLEACDLVHDASLRLHRRCLPSLGRQQGIPLLPWTAARSG